MQRPHLFAALLSLSALVACDSDKPKAAEPAKVAEPAKAAEPAAPGDVTFSQNDRSKDPEFALRTEGHNYIGLVLDSCPGGFRIANHLRDRPSKLEGDKLLLELPFGGCALWTGYAVVLGEGSPLPFHLCEDIAHDPCEMNGRKTWVFDIGEALKKNGASAVTYVAPPAQ